MNLNFKTFSSCLLALGCASFSVSAQQKQPNVILYLTEDLSPHFLAMYNNGKGAQTPNLEALAAEGVDFTNTYSNAPVSSAARTTLITGCYAPRFAGSFHRCIEEFSMPEGLHMFPYYLRQEGYFTHSSNKTDYNVDIDSVAWNKITKNNSLSQIVREREGQEQPFFLHYTNMATHEYNLHFTEQTFRTKKTRANVDDANILSIHPDTKLMRYTYAKIYDQIESVDKELGLVVGQLRKSGELDNTFIIFVGDNGGVLPGTKGYTNNIGFEVPMVVYIPKLWREQLGVALGSKREDLVSFIDLAPTILNLAGIKAPKQMDGKPLLGKGAIDGHKAVYGYGDRYDEYYAFNRMVRIGNYRYARNYKPYQPKGLYSNYRYRQLAFKEWHSMWIEGALNAEQSKFFETQPVEELYDLAKDPMEKVNLAEDPAYAKQVKAMRKSLNGYITKKCDLGFIPENIIIEQGLSATEEFAKQNKRRIATYCRIADLQCGSYSDAAKELKKAMLSDDMIERWWAYTTAASFGKEAEELCEIAQKDLRAPRAYLRSRAMIFLETAGFEISPKQIQSALDMSQNLAEAVELLNDITFLVDYGYLDQFELNISQLPFESEYITNRTEHIAGRLN